jgi:hypothetical protein
MIKFGKVGVTFIVKRNLKPQIQSPILGGGERYPLYVQVNYNRKNTQFRSIYRKFYVNKDDAFATIEDREQRKYEENLLKSAVEYEIKSQGNSFRLKGIGERSQDYSDSLDNPIDRYFRDILFNVIIKSKSEFSQILDPWQNEAVSFDVYIKAAFSLMDNLEHLLPKDFEEERKLGLKILNWTEMQKSDVRIIDWLDHTAIKKFESDFKKKNTTNIESQDVISFVNRILKIKKGLTV